MQEQKHPDNLESKVVHVAHRRVCSFCDGRKTAVAGGKVYPCPVCNGSGKSGHAGLMTK